MISLKSIARAGYLWKIELVPDIIQLLGSEIEKPAGDTRPGDSTTQIFRCQALKPGEHTITFMLSRPWENKAIQTGTVKVTAS